MISIWRNVYTLCIVLQCVWLSRYHIMPHLKILPYTVSIGCFLLTSSMFYVI